MSGSQRGWVATGALAAVVAGGYLGLVPMLGSLAAGPQWPEALEAMPVHGQPVRVTLTEEAPGDAGRTLIGVRPTSGAKVTAKPAIKRGRVDTRRRTLVRQAAPVAPTAPSAAAPAPAAVAEKPAAPPAKRTPVPQRVEVVPIDVPVLSADEDPTAVDEDPVVAGSDGGTAGGG